MTTNLLLPSECAKLKHFKQHEFLQLRSMFYGILRLRTIRFTVQVTFKVDLWDGTDQAISHDPALRQKLKLSC